jgi:hypothetical protein
MKAFVVGALEGLLSLFVIGVTVIWALVGMAIAAFTHGAGPIGFLLGGAIGFLIATVVTGISFTLLEINSHLKKIANRIDGDTDRPAALTTTNAVAAGPDGESSVFRAPARKFAAALKATPNGETGGKTSQ